MGLDKETRKQEDEYFARIEFEKRKQALEEKQGHMKKAERKRLMERHWMHCPKCGMEMVEITFEGIRTWDRSAFGSRCRR